MERDTFKDLDSHSQVIVLFDTVTALPDKFIEKMEDKFPTKLECEKTRKACAGSAGAVPWKTLIGLLVTVIIYVLSQAPGMVGKSQAQKQQQQAVSRAK